MISAIRRVPKHLFGISPEEATFARREFHETEAGTRRQLEHIGEVFLHGYHSALAQGEPEALVQRLNTVETEFRGFAFEGAAMGLTLLDRLTLWKRNRLRVFLNGPGADHVYMVHVGAGWALARLPFQTHWPPTWLDPLLGWLAIDGYGFHEGYFYWREYVEKQTVPKRLGGYARRVFDQGVGRSLWFVDGADVVRIPATVAAFPLSRRADLWSGIGLACAYAGGVESRAIEELRIAAGPHQPDLAQGAAFAAKARQRANNPAPHTELACEILCGLSADAAATITDVALEDLPPDDTGPAYEIWRRRIRGHFAQEAMVL